MEKTQMERLHEILKEFDTAMLLTRAAEGKFRGRPMAISQVEQNCDLWFITQKDSGKVEEIESDHDVEVTMQNGWKSSVYISGTASVIQDRAKIDEIWNERYKVWFPNGKDDPSIALIHVRGKEAQYWDQSGASKLKYLYEAVHAYATGTKPRLKEGEQFGNVDLERSRRLPSGKPK